MYQHLILVGNLGRDPELRYTPQGTAVCTFPVATSRKYKNAAEETKEETTWFRVTAWGKTGETVNEYLAKGSRVLVEGTLVGDETGSPKCWMGKDGKPHASFEIRANGVKFLSAKSDTQPKSEVK